MDRLSEMKYYLFLFATLVFLIAQVFMIYFLWDVNESKSLNSLLIFGLVFFIYLFYKNLNNYSKIERINNSLIIRKIFTKRIYDLNQLTSWKELTNLYRVRFRQLDLDFKGTKVKLIDHTDYDGVEQLYHFLRVNYSQLNELKTEPNNDEHS